MAPTQRQRIAALDGLRGLAVVAVLAFHADWSWAGGGFLGVSLFFTLSGYLITSVLLDDDVTLGRFWARRARRLLPAAIVTLVAVLVADRLGAFGDTTGLDGDALASLAQIANWRFLVDGQSYADLFGDASPLLHYWSLSIEEQWYLLLPLTVLAIRRFGGGPGAIGAVLAATTVVSMALPWVFSMSADRVYYGTDTRIAEITIGGVAAVAIAARNRRALHRRPPMLLGWLAPAAFVAMVASWVLVERTDPAFERGAFAAHAILAIIVVVAAASGTMFARPLGWAPLVALGRISYALYLVHWPLWLWLDADTTGLDDPWLSVVRLVAAVAAAVTLHRLVETPILDGLVFPRPSHALGALAGGAVAVIALSATIPAATIAVDFDAAAAAARPEGLAGTTLDEIAASAEAAAAASDGSAARAIGPISPERPSRTTEVPRELTETAPPTPAAPAIELSPAGELSLGQALDIVAATGTGFYAGTETEPDATANRALAFDPASAAQRTIVFGDSAALMLGFGLTDWGRATGSAQVVDLGVVGCGLMRGGLRLEPNGAVDVGERCGDWAPAFSSLADLLEPDLVMLHYGLWETVDRLISGWDDWRSIGDADFDRLLVEEIRTATRIFTDRGIAVAWVTSPPLAPAKLPDIHDPIRIERLNALIEETIAGEAGATVIDLHAWFANRPAGPMDPALRPDGVHVSFEGSDVVATWLGPRLVRALERPG